MIDRMMKTTVFSCGLMVIAGCSLMDKFFGAKEPQPQMAASQQESYVSLWLDGTQAKAGEVRSSIAQPVGVSPKLKYEISKPEKLGRVSNVIINIFREFEGGYSSNADFIVTAADVNNPDAQMKPGVVYDLGAPGKDLRIMDRNGKTLETLKLDAGTKYLMNFVISADRSETVQVEFKTK
jgi:hypothetical protein